MAVAEGVVHFGQGGDKLVALHTQVEVDGIEGVAEVARRADQAGALACCGGEKLFELLGNWLIVAAQVVRIAERQRA